MMPNVLFKFATKEFGPNTRFFERSQSKSPNLHIRAALLCACILASFAALFMATPAYGQIDRGTIQGLVTDQSGAVVPDAKVQVINTATNSTITLGTNADGLYSAANLPTGTYKVVISKEGFSSATRENIELRPSITLRSDFALTPGQVTQSVTVTGEGPILDVGTTNNSAGMQDVLIEKMPVIVAGTQRAITDYLAQMPGYTGGGSFTPTANGAATGDTMTYIDGGPADEWGLARGGIGEVSPSIEQVQEMSVVSNAFNAEYGGFGSWFTNVVLKSGTNELHGSVYNHLGNSVLNAKSYFSTGVTPFRQNEGGFTVGGPVVLGKLYNGRNKTFFFGSLGMFFSRVGSSGTPMTIPTPKECSGDFTELGVNIYDPLTHQQFQYQGRNNVMDPTRITQAAKLICTFVPTPDIPGAGFNNNFHSRNAPTWPYFNIYTPLVKMDHSFSDRESFQFPTPVKFVIGLL